MTNDLLFQAWLIANNFDQQAPCTIRAIAGKDCHRWQRLFKPQPMLGGRRLTSPEAVLRYMDALTVAKDRS